MRLRSQDQGLRFAARETECASFASTPRLLQLDVNRSAFTKLRLSMGLLSRWLLFAALLGTIGAQGCYAAMLSTTRGVDVPVESSGGELQLRWNRPLLETLGLRILEVRDQLGETETGFDRFSLRADSNLAIISRGRGLTGITSGTLYVHGGYELAAGQTAIHFEDFTLSSVVSAPRRFDIATLSGEKPFFADKLMVEAEDAGHSVAIRTMDLRISDALARQIGKPEVAGWQIATLRTFSRVVGPVGPTTSEICPASSKWAGMPVPGHPGETYQTDVFMRQFSVQLTACKHCTGPGGKGLIKITPTTLLQNNVNNGTSLPTVPGDKQGVSTALFSADVPWRQMFSKDCPPYSNDQHPYLTWNLYRVDASGTLDQIARSGVKHGHIAENGDCADYPGTNHILGRGCTDAYGTGDNDVPAMLGPRSEIIPATGQWGRCGSIYDPECKGALYHFQGYDDFTYRLLVSESTLDPQENAGAHFYMEAWYVVRDDINPYNSMATLPIKATWYPTNHLWSVSGDGPSTPGPMIDHWVDPSRAEAMAASREIVTKKGHIKVAVRISKGSTDRYRYDYVVMNVDYASVRTAGHEPNLRIRSTHGLTDFAVSVGSNASIDKRAFHGVVSESTPPWKSAIAPGTVAWHGGASAELTWGTLFHFSFESNSAPRRANVAIGTGTETYKVTLPTPE